MIYFQLILGNLNLIQNYMHVVIKLERRLLSCIMFIFFSCAKDILYLKKFFNTVFISCDLIRLVPEIIKAVVLETDLIQYWLQRLFWFLLWFGHWTTASEIALITYFLRKNSIWWVLVSRKIFSLYVSILVES